MLLRTFFLKEFIQVVPVCSDQAALAEALALSVQQNDERLVLLDDRQRPVGVVRLSQWLPYFLQALPLTLREMGTPPTAVEEVSMPYPDWLQRPILQTPYLNLEALAPVPAHWTVEQFLDQWPSDHSTVALVNEQGYFLGLVDTPAIARTLTQALGVAPPVGLLSTQNAAQGPLQEATAPPVPTVDLRPPNSISTPQSTSQQQVLQLTQQLLAQRAELEQRIKVQQEEIAHLRRHHDIQSPTDILNPLSTMGLLYSLSSHQTLLNSLQQLLEHLPIPLMLQTNSGKVLAQNLVWRKQVGELSDPVAVWREAAIWLGSNPPMPEEQERSPLASPSPTEPGASTEPSTTGDSALEQHLCHLGDTDDVCICVCPLKNGHEQVLQFVKIPLGTLLPDLHLDWAIPAPPTSVATTAHSSAGSMRDRPFQLAVLSTDTDTTTHSTLTQTTTAPSPSPLETTTATSTPEILWLVLSQDMTEQQQLARELTAKNADLVQLNRLKDEFLACISHELKTPLTAVLGLSSLLKDQTLGEMNQRQVHYAQLIYQSSRHLMAVVNDILDLTRIETGQLELLYEPVNIAAACSKAFEQAKQIRLTDLKSDDSLSEELLAAQFSLEIEPGLDILVADDLRLRQMLVHLLSNSLKFTEANKPIGLKVNRWGGWIAFTVWDTGIGIPADKQHLIFQKFQQLENPLTRRFEGAGLGLVLTRRLARLHGGDVTFITKEGQGSQFTVLLPPHPPEKTYLVRGDDPAEMMQNPAELYPGGRVPVHAQVETTAGTTSLLSPLSRSRLMLIVDAVPQFVETLTNHLTGLGYRVAIARSGTEALEKARRLQPCIIFLNPSLPMLSGWDVLTLLKSNPKTQQLPVVITATGMEDHQAQHSQVDGFLSLPIQSKELQQVLQQLLLGRKQSDSQAEAPERLTILHLYPEDQVDAEQCLLAEHINHLLQAHRYRILESHDLEQAELLARVWKPNVLLLSHPGPNPQAYLRQLSYLTFLAALPLITLDQETTHAANQISGLLVFPCLPLESRQEAAHTPEFSMLQQVLQIAAGHIWQPLVLAVDVADLPLTNDVALKFQPVETTNRDVLKETEWLQALMQYLRMAGLRGVVGRSWQELLQQVSSHSVDLLLLCWTQEPSAELLEQLHHLAAIAENLPIVVLDHRSRDGAGQADLPALPEIVSRLSNRILLPHISMTDLLEELQTLMDV